MIAEDSSSTSVPLLMYIIIFPLAPREPRAAVQMSEIAAY